MRSDHAYIGLIRDRDGGFKFWTGHCKCGWKTQVEHLARAGAMGALMEHIVAGRQQTEIERRYDVLHELLGAKR